jgi:hypothetical protein
LSIHLTEPSEEGTTDDVWLSTKSKPFDIILVIVQSKKSKQPLDYYIHIILLLSIHPTEPSEGTTVCLYQQSSCCDDIITAKTCDTFTKTTVLRFLFGQNRRDY